MGDACVISTVWNETERLPRWLSHYGAAVGPENLFVVDDGSDDGSTDDIAPVNVVRWPRGRYDNRARVERVSALAAELLGRYRTVVYADCDEFLVPFDGSSLADWLRRDHPPTVTAIGLDVLEVPNADAAFDPARPLLSQRRRARLNPTYCKPLVTRTAIRWRPGFHFSDADVAFDDLLLLHTRYADRGLGLRRLVQLGGIEVEEPEIFATHWKAGAAAFTNVLDQAESAPWRPFEEADMRLWERLLAERLQGHPPNAVSLIRHLWDEHPSWFILPESLRCEG